MDSQELTAFYALAQVHQDEREREEERAKHACESDDGQVIEHNKPPGRFDEDDDGDQAE
jgi:hypothetical protein